MEKESQNATVKTPSLVMYIIRMSLKILMYSSYFFSLNQMDFIYIFIYFNVQDKTGLHNNKTITLILKMTKNNLNYNFNGTLSVCFEIK